MYLSAITHYKNKYPGGSVRGSDDSVDVYCEQGQHRVALRKDGSGQWRDMSEVLGCTDRHDLAPIPKDARVHKLYKDGKIGKSEESKAREKVAAELAKHPVGGPGKVPSIQELYVFHNPEADPLTGYRHDSSWADMKPSDKK